MIKVPLKSQIAALELALGRNGPGIWREGHQEVHRKHLDAALETLRQLDAAAERETQERSAR